MPLFESNFHMIDESALSQMKDGVVLINTARGGLIDTKALIKGLESGKVGAAGLDAVSYTHLHQIERHIQWRCPVHFQK